MDSPDNISEKQTIYDEGYYEGKMSCQKEIERLKKAGNKQDDEIYKLSCDVIVKDEKIEQLKNRVNEIDDYGSGTLNGYGEGDVAWWQDYIRSEVAICNDHWRQALKEEGSD